MSARVSRARSLFPSIALCVCVCVCVCERERVCVCVFHVLRERDEVRECVCE